VNALLSTPGGRTFFTMWIGQSVSSFGTRLTTFAFAIWLFQKTGEATPATLAALAGFLPGILLAPIAGVIVDRSNRRSVMLWINTVHTLVTLAQFALIASGVLQGAGQLWLVYILLAISSAAETFQYPAESASLSALVPKEHLGQANGLYSMMGGAGDLIAPIAGGALIAFIGIQGILLFDLLSYIFEFVTLFLIRIPNPQPGETSTARVSVIMQAKDGFRFITARPGLLSLLITFTGINFLLGLIQNLQAPLILSRTNNDSSALGLISAMFGLGVLAGGAYMTSTGGIKPRVHGVFTGIGLSGLLGTALFGLAQSIPIWMLANFFAGFFLPVLNGSSQSIWQSKTPNEILGRVFTARRQIAQITSPIAFFISGPLADRVFNPVFSSPAWDGWAWLLGTQSGRGFAVMYLLFGLTTCAWGLAGYLRPAARNVERDIPDAAALV
jgi:MFS transporter, DHA3 family, macrolide efflux protein